LLVGYVSLCALYRQSGSDRLAGRPILIATKPRGFRRPYTSPE
jgi:hypothetical protein